MTLLAQVQPQHMLLAGVFLGVLLLVEGLRQALTGDGRHEGHRSRRLKLLQAGKTEAEVIQIMQARPRVWALDGVPVIGTLPLRLRQAGLSLRPEACVAVCLGLTLLAGALALRLAGPGLAVLAGPALGMGAPWMLLNMKRRRWLDAFTTQLPDALDLMMRGLRVGHPLGTTIANVALTMDDPIASEFGLLADQVAYGDSLTDAFRDMAARIDQEDMHYLAVSVGIQHGTGGNLGAMLGVLSKVIRDRAMMRRKVRAISSEGRISATLLSCLPLVIYGATSLTSPDYYGAVADDPLYTPIVIAILVLVTANFLTLRKLASFRF